MCKVPSGVSSNHTCGGRKKIRRKKGKRNEKEKIRKQTKKQHITITRLSTFSVVSVVNQDIFIKLNQQTHEILRNITPLTMGCQSRQYYFLFIIRV